MNAAVRRTDAARAAPGRKPERDLTAPPAPATLGDYMRSLAPSPRPALE